MTTSKKGSSKPTLTARIVLEYVLKHGDACPISDDEMCEVQSDDLPEAVHFDEDHWTSCTKKAWGDYNGVEGPQVSRWIKHGLPVRPDGRINVWEASRWLDKFYEDHKRRTGRDIVADKLARTVERLRMMEFSPVGKCPSFRVVRAAEMD